MMVRKSKHEPAPITASITAEKPQEEEAPSLVSIDEFLSTIKKKYRVETLGGFIHWIRLGGKPPRMSIQQWNDKLTEFMTRKV